jgi:hypothetical protein
MSSGPIARKEAKQISIVVAMVRKRTALFVRNAFFSIVSILIVDGSDGGLIRSPAQAAGEPDTVGQRRPLQHFKIAVGIAEGGDRTAADILMIPTGLPALSSMKLPDGIWLVCHHA